MTQNKFNYDNIYKLITKEDGLHIHKILGGIILVNYCYRYFYYILIGNMNFTSYFDIYLLCLHGLLSTSSLIFHISGVRNPQQPMIYPEYRMHSIIFALRSICCCIIHFYNYNYKYIMLISGSTFILADIITFYYNPSDKNCKNGKTMRNMPFNKEITLEEQNNITVMHSYHQIGASLYMFGNIDTAFSPMFAIQIAAFLMTLVRKGIINSYIWHLIYSLSLWLNYILYTSFSPAFFILMQLIVINHINIIFKYKINKYVAWSIYFLIIIWYKEYGYEKMINEYIIQNYNIEWYYFIHLFIITNYIIVFYKYRSLFNIKLP